MAGRSPRSRASKPAWAAIVWAMYSIPTQAGTPERRKNGLCCLTTTVAIDRCGPYSTSRSITVISGPCGSSSPIGVPLQSMLSASHRDGGVAAAERERRRHEQVALPASVVADEIDRRQMRVAIAVPRMRGKAAPCVRIAEQQPAEAELERARRTERVADQRFRRAAGHLETEYARQDRTLHLVVLRRGRAVQVHVADVARQRSGLRQRGADRGFGAEAARIRRRDVVAVGGFSDGGEAHGGGYLRHDEDARTLADVDAATIRAERVAAIGRERLERVEAVQRQLAEAVDTADDRGVAAAGREQPPRGRERLGRRRARRRDRVTQARQFQ